MGLDAAAPRGFGEPPQHRANPGLYDLGTGGLDDVVVGAGLQSHDHVEVVAARGEHDDRQLAGLADAAAHLDAVHPRQHEVEQDEFGPELRQRGQSRLARPDGPHLVPAPTQPQLDPFPYGGVVFDQQHARHGVSIPAVKEWIRKG